jgi:cephalosporin-C deacetylase-like acetyl esterase
MHENAVHEYYLLKLRQMRAERLERLGAVRSRASALSYQRRVRRAIRRALGPLPPRTPLKARTTDTVVRSAFSLEKVLFESRPGCLVTAHLYIPTGLQQPAPAVLGSCGHSPDGKAEAVYQEFCQRLARAGFVVLIYDPFNQGERDQYYKLKDRRAVASCTHAHNMMGKQLELVGEWFGAWRAWDGIRALDYLLSRPEVDRRRVGLTGNSGGGTMTTWMWAIEPRITMAAPSCFVTTFTANFENELPADCEQYPPGVVGSGLEMADFIIARAPDPVLLLGQQYCFFDLRGLEEAYGEVRSFYDVLRVPPENARLFVGPRRHGFFRENQEAMVDFFCCHAGLKRPKRVARIVGLGAAAVNVTPKGNTVAAGAVPIYTQTARRATELRDRRPAPAADRLKTLLAECLHLPERKKLLPPHFRVLRPAHLQGRTIARYMVETELPARALLHKRMSDASRAYSLDVEKTVHLLLPHVSSAEDLVSDPLGHASEGRHSLYALDTRGMGDFMPEAERRNFTYPYGMDYMYHGYGLLFGESYLGRRVHDVLSTLDLLVSEGARDIHLYGRGQGALLALFAALFHSRIRKVVLKNAPLSYGDWTQAPLVAWPAANFPRGVLHHFDIPDCIRALGEKVTLRQPWGPDMKPLRAEQARRRLKQLGLPLRRLSRS